MLMDRIVGAFTFKKGVYLQTANDATFTNTAWMLVLVVAFLEQLGAHGGILSLHFIRWFISGVILAVVAVAAFALAVFLVAWAATNLFKATVTFEQLQRAMGLAFVWHIIGVIGVFGFLVSCITSPIVFLASLAGLAANLFAIKETSNMDWAGTVVSAVLAWVVMVVIIFIAVIILGVVHLL